MRTLTTTFILGICFITNQLYSQVELVAEKTGSSVISNLTPVGDKLFFSFGTEKDSLEIWCSKGTLNSSKMIKKLLNYGNSIEGEPMFFSNYKESLIFSALENYTIDKNGNYTLFRYLWKSDGTVDGTIKLKRLDTWYFLDDDFPNTWGGKCFQLGDKIIFPATTTGPENFELWSTDGTPEGTTNLLEINKNNGSSYPTSLVNVGNKIFFSADDAINGQELWVSDGSIAGTHLVKDLTPGVGGSFGRYYYQDKLVTSNEKVFFTADMNRQLGVSDGTDEGTIKITKFNYPDTLNDKGLFVGNLTDVNGELFFEVYYWNFKILDNDSVQLWKSDGTENGTAKVYSINKMNVSSFTSYKSNLYFLNKNDSLYELWKSDGTRDETLKISEFLIPENTTSKLYTFNDSIYFAALDGDKILKIWKSDGSKIGTNPVENWNESNFTSISDLVLFNDGIYFSATQPDYGTALFKYMNGAHLNSSKIEPLANSNKISISPNPANEMLVINIQDNTASVCMLFNLNGQMVKTLHITQGFNTVDVSTLKSGLYLLQLPTKTGIITQKMIKN